MTITLVAPVEGQCYKGQMTCWFSQLPLTLACGIIGQGPARGFMLLGLGPVLSLVSSQGVGS